MRPRLAGHVLTIALTALVGGAFAFALLRAAGTVGTGDAYVVRAPVPTTGAIAPGSRVTMAGVEVGRVSSIDRGPTAALLELEIDDERVVPIPEDSRVAVRLHTPIGESYVELVRGRAGRTIADGGTLARSSAEERVDLDQILSVLKPPVGARARSFLQGLGGGVDGQGERINRLLGATGSTLVHGADVTRQLDGQRGDVAGLVDDLGDVMRQIGARQATIQDLSRGATRTLQVLASQNDAVRAGLQELPPTLRQVRATTDRISAVTGSIAPVLEDTGSAVDELAPAIRALRPAADEGRALVREVDTAVTPLRSTLAAVRSASDPVTKALPQVRRVLCQVNPVLRYAEPYANDIVSMLATFGSAINAYDSLGHLIRVQPIIGDNSYVGAPEPISRGLRELIHGGLLTKSNGIGYDAYPDPNRAGKNDGLGVHGPADVKKQYPRIKADC